MSECGQPNQYQRNNPSHTDQFDVVVLVRDRFNFMSFQFSDVKFTMTIYLNKNLSCRYD